MESPAEREAVFEQRINRNQANCKAIREEWAAPNHQDGEWQVVRTSAHTPGRLSLGGTSASRAYVTMICVYLWFQSRFWMLVLRCSDDFSLSVCRFEACL
jgi:hypothetical protein